MEWILDHIQFIAIVAGVVAYWINQRRREKEGAEADYDGDGVPDNRKRRRLQPDARQSDPEVGERERRIRGEMLRKIAERRGGQPVPAGSPPALPSRTAPLQRSATAGPEDAPRPVSDGPLGELLRRALEARQRQEEAARAQSMAAENAERERQRRLHEQQLRELEEQRREELARAEEIARSQAPVRPPVPVAHLRGDFLQDLRGADNLRRAVLLREVLGPPVGLGRR